MLSFARINVIDLPELGGQLPPLTPRLVRLWTRKVAQPVGKVVNIRTTERHVVRWVAPPIVSWHDQLHDQSRHCVIRDYPQLVVRPCTTGGMIT